jgi:NADPH-ferrihemoprotein reductase
MIYIIGSLLVIILAVVLFKTFSKLSKAPGSPTKTTPQSGTGSPPRSPARREIKVSENLESIELPGNFPTEVVLYYGS